MAKSILDIVIKLSKEGGADQETITGLVKIKSGMKDAVEAAGLLVGAGYALNQAYQGTVQVFLDYAEQVETVTRNTGMSAEEASKLIRAGEDLKINYDSLSNSLYQLAKKGYEPSIANLKKMADEYVKLAPGVERVDYLTKHFGKSGEEMGKLLEGGSAQLQKYTDAVDANLVLTNRQLEQADQLKLTQKQLGDVWEGLSITIGSRVVPALTAWITLADRLITGQTKMNIVWTDAIPVIGPLMHLTKAYGDTFNELQSNVSGTTDALKNDTPAMEDNGAAAKAMADHYKGLLDLTMQMQSASDSYTQKVSDLNGKMADLNQQYKQGKIGASQYKTEMADLKGQLSTEAKAFEDSSKRIVFSLLQQKAAAHGMTDADFSMLLKVGEGMGIIDGNVAKSAQNISDSMGKLDTATPSQFLETMTGIMGMPQDKAIAMTLDHFDIKTTGQMYSDLSNIYALGPEKKVTLIIDVKYPNGKPPDLNNSGTGTGTGTGTGNPQTPQARGSTWTVGGVGGMDTKLVQFMASPGEVITTTPPGSKGSSGGGIHIENLHVTLSKGMTAADFENLLRRGRA